MVDHRLKSAVQRWTEAYSTNNENLWFIKQKCTKNTEEFNLKRGNINYELHGFSQ